MRPPHLGKREGGRGRRAQGRGGEGAGRGWGCSAPSRAPAHPLGVRTCEGSVSAVDTCVLDAEISGILLLNVKRNRKNKVPSTEFPGRAGEAAPH